jgi:hypothetical protein
MTNSPIWLRLKWRRLANVGIRERVSLSRTRREDDEPIPPILQLLALYDRGLGRLWILRIVAKEILTAGVIEGTGSPLP